MTDPLYTRLAFTSWIVEYETDSTPPNVEIFDVHTLMMNGFETIPDIKKFVETAFERWRVHVNRITDPRGHVLYLDKEYERLL
jgi:hypothetical protein